MSAGMPQTPSGQQLQDLKGKELSLLEFLGFFNARRRDASTVPSIEQTLRNAGLATVPYFVNCAHDATVHIVAVESVTAEEAEAEAEANEDVDVQDAAGGSLPQRPLSIGDVLPAGGGVECLPPNAPLTTVTHLMRINDYSQLPIIEGQYHLRGVVTWRSVARMYEQGAAATLANASEAQGDWSVAQETQDFFSLLPLIGKYGYALIRRSDGVIGGIVTAADITERFAATAQPFFLIGEIELRLRKCLGMAIDADAIRAVQRKNQQTGQISDLSFGDYVTLLDGQNKKESLRPQADRNWHALQWTGVDRVQFVHKLDRVRDIRNKIAHFHPQPLAAHLQDELQRFCQLMRQYVTDI
ncbi:CBS domain-containing protein [Streptomyces sp. NPDC007872]|uniref:CBS domain-containing protein n=1 Tax=Streptomyces sp. NPDC007872 TaxID=3364782 RepID=UPI0036AA9E38